MSGMQFSILAYKNLRPQEVVKSLNSGMAEPRSNVGSICKTAEKGIMVRSLKGYFLPKNEVPSKRNKAKRLNLLPKGLILKVPHLDLLSELDNEDCRSIHLRQSGSHLSYPYWTWGDRILA